MTLELVVMVGLQGSGKSTWVREQFSATDVIVSKDHWPRPQPRGTATARSRGRAGGGPQRGGG